MFCAERRQIRYYKKLQKKAKKKNKNYANNYYKDLKKRRKNGLCKGSLDCKEPLIGKTPYCLDHWCEVLQNTKHYNSKRNKLFFNVKELWEEQKGRCAITNVELIPGINASLDHIIPIAKGGTNSKNNMRFIHKSLNGFKNDLTENEFKTLLKSLLPQLQLYVNYENLKLN